MAWEEFVPGHRGKKAVDYAALVAANFKAVGDSYSKVYASRPSIIGTTKDGAHIPGAQEKLEAAAKAAGMVLSFKEWRGSGTDKGYKLVATRTK